MIKRLDSIMEKVDKAKDRRRIKTMERFWVRDNSKINLLNYIFYRYLTNKFELYILDAINFVEVKK